MEYFLEFCVEIRASRSQIALFFDADPRSRKSEFPHGKTHFSDLRKRCQKTIAKRRALAGVRVFSVGKVVEKTAIRLQIAVFPERCFAMHAKGSFPPTKLRF